MDRAGILDSSWLFERLERFCPDGSRADIGALPVDESRCGPAGVYCVAKTSSNGCVPGISASGVPSVTDPVPFHVEADEVINNKLGILLYRYDWQTVKFQGGILCLRGPIRRTLPQSSRGNPPPNDCSGAFSFDFNALIQSGAAPELTAGSTNYAQYWYRDGGAASGTGLTDALRVAVCP